MKQLYSVFTYYQLITAIQIKTKIFPNAEGDLLISDHSDGYERVAEKLRKMNIFKNVLTVKAVDSMTLNTASKKIKRVIDIVLNNNNFAEKCMEGVEFFYDEFLFFNFNYLDSCIYYKLKKKNPSLICRRFEEGYTSGFKFNIFITGSAQLQQKFEKIHHNPNIMDIDEMFFYEPKLVLFENKCNLTAIPKFNKNDENMRAILNTLFDYSSPDSYNPKYVFFEESYFTDGKEMGDLDLVMKIANKVGKENLMVKLHPRTKKDRFSDLGIKTNKTVGIPWEVIIMNNDFSDKVFLTIASGSVLSPRIIFGDKSPTYMLFNCTRNKPPIITDDFFRYLTKFKDKFGSEGFYIPENCNDFFKML